MMTDMYGPSASKRRRIIYDKINTNQLKLDAAQRMAKGCRDKHYQLLHALNETVSISSLPTEMLTEIFYALPPFKSSNGLPKRYVLGAVCHRWRTIVQATPRLWCMISIKINEAHCIMQKCLIETSIRRSHKMPLDIRILVDRHSLWEPPIELFQMLVSSCCRWQSFICPAFRNLSDALAEEGHQTPLRFPVLKSLWIQKYPIPTTRTTLKKWNFNFPPRLEDLDIMGTVSNPQDLEVNWKQLISLSTGVVLGENRGRFEECIPLKALAACDSLTYLSCKLNGSLTSWTSPFFISQQTVISLRSLNTLKLTGTALLVVTFMALTSLPALTDLDLEIFSANGPDSPEDPTWTMALVQWAKHSSFKLHSLEIWTDTLYNDRHMVDLLRRLSPSQPISNLIIGGPNLFLSDSLISRFTVRWPVSRNSGKPLGSSYLPQLSLFAFSGKISFSISTLSFMLNSRTSTEGRSINEGNRSFNTLSSRLGTPTGLNQLKIQFDIKYGNRDWFQKQDPNEMIRLFRVIEDYQRGEELFTLWWDDEGRRSPESL